MGGHGIEFTQPRAVVRGDENDSHDEDGLKNVWFTVCDWNPTLVFFAIQRFRERKKVTPSEPVGTGSRAGGLTMNGGGRGRQITGFVGQ